MIGIYDDNERHLVIYKLETVEDIKRTQTDDLNTSQVNKIITGEYGKFRPIHKIEDFRMLPTDITLESGSEHFFYMARQNKIFKVYTSDEAVRQAQKDLYQMSSVKELSKIPDLSDLHPNL